jgi:ABC-2 type transport system ATP-binding protein
MPNHALEVVNLRKRYGTVDAVNGITFSVATGQIFALLGPNGAGKTTTIECILGLRRPDAGSIILADIDALAHPASIKPLIGAQLQSTALQQKITPRQALRLFGSFYPRHLEPDQLLEQFDLAAKADATFDSLSGGQQQRLALALAFVNDPRIVVLDEPTAGLDPLARRQLHEMIRQARGAGRTIVLSTHDLDEAEHLCDAVAIIDGGTVIATGSPAHLIAAAAAPCRLLVQTARPLTAQQAHALPAVGHALSTAASTWQLDTTDINRTILALVQLLGAQANDLLDLQIRRPSLEDVYLQQTGKRWSDTPPLACARG